MGHKLKEFEQKITLVSGLAFKSEKHLQSRTQHKKTNAAG